ncbi:dihydrofolate reductase family protein [Corynebacterium kalidii]|uniref:Dihydrofolate reductase family protein n=1 Tax=Corynebacterium kalidii TaxID=2931982 RepID=A0A9X1WHC0_9CORY|nr:dihydrofolate reductase family protein [Corynebacterium kalidii]MCJ7858516.1 dihydrofolate reductase family protein [Corynebacterium kalidii]
MTTHYFTASSLDGYIATTDHSLDWLTSQDFAWDGPMSPTTFVDGIGAIAMGATTYEWILANDDGWAYETPAWVFTHRDLPTPDGADVRFTSSPVPDVHAEMTAAAGGNDLWIVGGGDLAGQFADAGLLDEVWIQYAPVTLGDGAPLLPRPLTLELLDTQRNRALVCTRFRVVT